MSSTYTKALITKQAFHIKPIYEKGWIDFIHQITNSNASTTFRLILRIHHVIGELSKIRFVHVGFNNMGHVLATGDCSGYIFIIDFSILKFWGLPNLGSCTVLKFSVLNDSEILIGLETGIVSVINIHSGEIVSNLESHSHPVTDISFSRDYLCITSSRCEAVIWDLKSNCKLHILTLETDCILKQVSLSYFVHVTITMYFLGIVYAC